MLANFNNRLSKIGKSYREERFSVGLKVRIKVYR